MLRRSLTGLSSLMLILGLIQTVWAGDRHCPCQHCNAADGCCYHDVVSYRCVLVPDKKPIKKTVYECKEVPYCEHRLPKFGHCDCCPDCMACPKFKKVLIKREVVVGEICTTKCVVEEFMERVPGPCCQCGHVPCGDGKEPVPATPAQPVPPMPPAEATAA